MDRLGRQLLHHVKRKARGIFSKGGKKVRCCYSTIVPKADPVNHHVIDDLARFISDKKRLLVITGAGCR